MAPGQGVTIFTTPRPFKGQYEIIQTNAFRSWSLMDPAPNRVVVFADRDHEGDRAVDLALSLNFEVHPIEQRSPRGVPLLSDLFPRAQGMGGIPCYVNADIILGNDLVPAIQAVVAELDRCLMICRRWNVQILTYLDFQGDWKTDLHTKVDEQGSLMVECAVDLFAWTGKVYSVFKPYALGRYRWDNWLVGAARAHNAPIVDITPCVKMIHQSHAQVPWNDPDAQENFQIVGAFCGTKDSTHTLTPSGLVAGWRG